MAIFRARARALDMLGRQQIAGIPTALSEIFKNAHDAYATRVSADYYRSDGLLVIRDNGLGMSEGDFVERWLTLGTDSKLGTAHGLPPPAKDLTMRPRPIMGEKGIGRLAIAALGPQVLVLTRPKTPTGSTITAAFVQWRLFECPGLDLHEIDIPLKTFASGRLPTQEEVAALLSQARATVTGLRSRIDPQVAMRLLEDIGAFTVDPRRYFDTSLTIAGGNGHGTAFFVQPSDESLLHELNDEGKADTAPPLVKMLVGFTNALTRKRTDSTLTVQFFDHGGIGDARDLIGDSEFFTREDFRAADHRIVGRVDAFGAFSGTVSVYNEKAKKYKLPWSPGQGRPTACGPFTLQFAYVQGEPSHTRLPPDEHARLTSKLDRIGGLYIYRDGIRVLPYGNSDFDFLDIERRRSKNAAYYFFSYRRMFGAISITRTRNPELQEKAGREGFRSNKAYRQFRDILERLLIHLAADFFRSGGERASAWERTKEELERNDKIRKEREKAAKVARDAFQARLDEVLRQMDAKEPHALTKRVLADVQALVSNAAERAAKAGSSQLIEDAEATARKMLADLRARYEVTKPHGFALGRRQREDWNSYLEDFAALDKALFRPATERIEQLTTQAALTAKVAIDERRRAERALRQEIAEARLATAKPSAEVEALVDSIHERTAALVSSAQRHLEDVIASALTEFSSSAKQKEFSSRRTALASSISDAARSAAATLKALRERLSEIDLDAAEGGRTTEATLTEAMEEELLALKEREELDLGLAQLGSAVEIISHEFAASIKAVRAALRKLKAWSDTNAALGPLYDELRRSFDQLDGYLSLFTPLSRRLTRRATAIQGSEIADYIRALFKDRLDRHKVELLSTDAFRALTLHGYPSIFFPVFVNLVDNAIFWMAHRTQPRTITLDARGDTMLVRDTGQGVPQRDRERIFEQGFTRKPGGRGLGLFISRSVLRRAGYTLSLSSRVAERGTTFEIAPTSGNEA